MSHEHIRLSPSGPIVGQGLTGFAYQQNTARLSLTDEQVILNEAPQQILGAQNQGIARIQPIIPGNHLRVELGLDLYLEQWQDVAQVVLLVQLSRDGVSYVTWTGDVIAWPPSFAQDVGEDPTWNDQRVRGTVQLQGAPPWASNAEMTGVWARAMCALVGDPADAYIPTQTGGFILLQEITP